MLWLLIPLHWWSSDLLRSSKIRSECSKTIWSLRHIINITLRSHWVLVMGIWAFRRSVLKWVTFGLIKVTFKLLSSRVLINVLQSSFKGLDFIKQLIVSPITFDDDSFLFLNFRLKMDYSPIQVIQRRLDLAWLKLLSVLSSMLSLSSWWWLNSNSRLLRIYHIFRYSDDEAWFSNVTILYFLVSQFIEDTECLALLCVSQSKFALRIHTNDTGLLVLNVNKHRHGWSYRYWLHSERIHSFWHFNAKTLFCLFVMQDSPKIDSIFFINSGIQIPTGNIFEFHLTSFLEFFKSFTRFEIFDFCEVE